jgi:hypothetical protein
MCEVILPSGRVIEIPCRDVPLMAPKWEPFYDSEYIKTYINPEWRGIGILLPPKFNRLGKGAYIGLTEALVPFCIIDKHEDECEGNFPVGDYLTYMASAAVLKIPRPMDWFMVFVRLGDDGKIDMKDIALLYYPDRRFRPPEDMLKGTRTDEDGGFIEPKPLE